MILRKVGENSINAVKQLEKGERDDFEKTEFGMFNHFGCVCFFFKKVRTHKLHSQGAHM